MGKLDDCEENACKFSLPDPQPDAVTRDPPLWRGADER